MDKFTNSTNQLRANHDWLNRYCRTEILDTYSTDESRINDQVDFDGKTQKQLIQELRSTNGEEWYRKNQTRLENPDVWAQYLSLN